MVKKNLDVHRVAHNSLAEHRGLVLFFLLGFTCGVDSGWHALQTDFALFSQRGLGGALTPGPSLVLVGVSIGALQFTAYE